MSESIAIDDDTEIDRLGPLTASSTPSEGSSSPTSFLPKSSLVAHSAASHSEAQDAVLHPSIHITIVCAQADSATTLHYAEAVRDGKLTIPIERIMPLAVVAEGNTGKSAEKGAIARIVLTYRLNTKIRSACDRHDDENRGRRGLIYWTLSCKRCYSVLTRSNLL